FELVCMLNHPIPFSKLPFDNSWFLPLFESQLSRLIGSRYLTIHLRDNICHLICFPCSISIFERQPITSSKNLGSMPLPGLNAEISFAVILAFFEICLTAVKLFLA